MLNDFERFGYFLNIILKINYWILGFFFCKVERSLNVLFDLGLMIMRLCIEDDVYKFLKLLW